jgi:hypothetical protein
MNSKGFHIKTVLGQEGIFSSRFSNVFWRPTSRSISDVIKKIADRAYF